MKTLSLTATAREQSREAAGQSSGRAARTVYGGEETRLRQTVIALAAGQELAEHDNPGEATVQVLQGRVVLRTDDGSQEGTAGDLLGVPDCVHALDAVDDSVVLLTVAKGTYGATTT